MAALAEEQEEDRPSFDPKAAAFIREEWVTRQMNDRSREFTELRDIKIFCGTWNVNGKKPDPEEDLALWLQPEQNPDIYCLGFQEIVDLNAVNVVADGKSKERSSKWSEVIETTLNSSPDVQYSLVHEKHLVGIMLCIFVRVEHMQHLASVASQTVGVGVMGMMGNKGGASIRMRLRDTTLCFVAAHLAAHRDNVAGRNADFANIIQKTVFIHEGNGRVVGADSEGADPETDKAAIRPSDEWGRSAGMSGKSLGIMDHDLVFFIGDFNYRIVESIPTEDVFERVTQGDLAFLWKNDQLNLERSQGNVFQAFEEGLDPDNPPFPPTYKFQPKTSEYEQRPDKKLRAPAWCDRVMWHAKTKDHIDQQSYFSVTELKISDHKPVAALFNSKCKTEIQEKKKTVYQEVIRTLDKWENDSLPQLELDQSSVDFGPVRYMIESQRTIKISNISQVLASWRFTNKPMETDEHKHWLNVDPPYGMLIPGESASINIRILIDNRTAIELNKEQEQLDDILLLHLENGRDYFINVTAQYARSCFGMALDTLVRTPEPVRNVPILASPADKTDFTSQAKQPPLSVPKELWRLVDEIYQKGLEDRNLFLTQGNPSEVEQIRECLDTGTEFASCSVYSIADALWSFLKSLEQPIIPSALFPSTEIDAQSIQPWSRRFLEQLPPVNYNVFVYMISFFREVLLHSEANRLTPLKLAVVCCNCMGQSASEDGDERELQRLHSLQLIISHFLTTAMV
uniref:Rho-GAP domain-containing protein n=1 Tax=Rhizochromulina marina TaxID=1034831 RepID=A0A7S2SHQ8_9STRA|mmetsp:Transcript_30434/g.88495  ORF Transcript_30434/g.88495 Transcript_30434/m.88495 type:complete len:740 (+) Transcript_30434:3-2222(+)